MSIASREKDIDHLARRDEVNGVAVALGILAQRSEELAHRRAKESVGVARIHPVAVQFDENPVRTTLDSDGRSAPEPQTIHRGRTRGRELAVFDSRYRP